MAVTYVERLSQSKLVGFPSSDPAVTNSFTPAAGERLLLIVAAQEVLAQTSDFTNAFDLSDSQGLTWTSIDAVANTTSQAIGMRAWISSPAAATAMTITLDCSFYFFFSNEFKVLGLTGAAGTIRGYVENNNAATDGGYTATLAAAPTTNDLTVFARFLDADAVSGLDMGTGWTVLSSVVNLQGRPLAVATRPSSTSTTVTVNDTQVDAQTVRKAVDFAFVVQAPTVVTGTAAAPLGGLAAAATGSPTVHGTAAAPLGALTSTAVGTPTAHGAAAASLGRLAAHATGTRIAGQRVGGGNWGDLRAILAETRLGGQVVRRGTECPNDGVLLRTGPGGVLYCPFDGWRGTREQAEGYIPAAQGYGETNYGGSGYGS